MQEAELFLFNPQRSWATWARNQESAQWSLFYSGSCVGCGGLSWGLVRAVALIDSLGHVFLALESNLRLPTNGCWVRVVWNYGEQIWFYDPWDPWDWYIFLLIYHRNQLNVGKYTNPMDPMGDDTVIIFNLFLLSSSMEVDSTGMGLLLVTMTVCTDFLGCSYILSLDFSESNLINPCRKSSVNLKFVGKFSRKLTVVLMTPQFPNVNPIHSVVDLSGVEDSGSSKLTANTYNRLSIAKTPKKRWSFYVLHFLLAPLL